MRDQASIQWDSAYRSIEAIVIDEYARATNDVIAGLGAIDRWLDGLDADTIADDAASRQRFDTAREPFSAWARSAKPRLARALADLHRIRSVAPELRRPADAYALVSKVVSAVELYESGVDAFLAGDFDNAAIQASAVASVTPWLMRRSRVAARHQPSRRTRIVASSGQRAPAAVAFGVLIARSRPRR